MITILITFLLFLVWILFSYILTQRRINEIEKELEKVKEKKMIKRMVFYTEYAIHDGMKNVHASEQRMLAKRKNLDLLNKWSKTETIKRIINIQEESYSNIDYPPSWEKLVCFYETEEKNI